MEMKNLKDSILEKLDINNVNLEILSENLKRKYKLIYNHKTNKYDCSGNIKIDDDLLENWQFKCNFGVVKGNFDCSGYGLLKSLEGAPEEVGGYFHCNYCSSLNTLEGAPKKVGGNFYCNYCEDLETLKGAPEEVGGDFLCSNCKSLTSLDGAPEKIGGDFDCEFCPNLRNIVLKTKIGGKFIK